MISDIIFRSVHVGDEPPTVWSVWCHSVIFGDGDVEKV